VALAEDASVSAPFRLRLSGRVPFLLGLLILVFAAGSGLSPFFLQESTVPYLLQYVPIIGLLGMGQTLIILAGGPGIDLSAGSMLSVVGLAVAALIVFGLNPYLSSVLGLVLGGLLGAGNGLLVTIVGIPSLIATLATMFLYGGLAVALTAGRPIGGMPESFAWLGQGTLFGLPNQFVFAFLPVMLVLHVMLTRTRLGSHITAVGNDERAAHLLGIKVVRIRLALYVLNGLLAALAAIVNLSWFLAARPDAGKGLELLAVTVSVLGGTHIFGGHGGIPGTVLAVLIVTTLQTGLQLANIQPAWQLGAIGILLIGSIVLNALFNARTAGAA
jgi:ribose/xylose/arabinose/galactoside ABC-type transport system permease subunit